jgi:uncharacterized protein with von Willebrand factor type A (vWA) domain
LLVLHEVEETFLEVWEEHLYPDEEEAEDRLEEEGEELIGGGEESNKTRGPLLDGLDEEIFGGNVQLLSEVFYVLVDLLFD